MLYEVITVSQNGVLVGSEYVDWFTAEEDAKTGSVSRTAGPPAFAERSRVYLHFG